MTSIAKYCSILSLECTSQWRNRFQWAQGVTFFLVSVLFFPLAIGSSRDTLPNIGPGYIWMMAMFAGLFSVDAFYKIDRNSGFLDKCLTIPSSLYYYTYAKVMAHWLLNGLPLVIAVPIIGHFYYIDGIILVMLILSLLIGTFILSLLAGLAAVLTLPIEHRSLLVPLLVIPLMVPVFILGTLTVYYPMQGISPVSAISLMIALLLIAMLVLPLASIYLLRYGNT